MELKRRFLWSLAGLLAVSAVQVIPAAAEAESKEPYWPLRAIGEETGAVISWKDKDRTAVWTKGDLVVEFPVDSSTIKWNGQTVRLEQPIRIKDDLTAVPASFFREYLGVELGEEGEGILNLIGRSREFVDRFREGSLLNPPETLSEELAALLKASPAPITWAAAEKQFGPLAAVPEQVEIERNLVHQSVHLTYGSAKGLLDVTIRWSQGRVDDFQFAAVNAYSKAYPYVKAEYDFTDSYREEEVVIGADPWQLPGTLTLPLGEGPFPAVILVHGSGPNDRDESLFTLKPFRDLAAGLAGKGIAVLRYEKRTKEHAMKAALTPQFTVNQETVEDAVYAAELLSKHPQIDSKRIYGAGHSLGGMMMPRISKADNQHLIKGHIVLSGPAKPLEELLVDQYKYMTGLGLATKEQTAQMERQREILQSKEFDPSNPPAEYILGSPYYWADLRHTYAAAEAASIEGPLLIVQGERDYQVPPDQLELWRQALKGRDDASFLSYPKLNHMLMEGEGQPTPQEYTKPSHVPSYVIEDLVKWVLAR